MVEKTVNAGVESKPPHDRDRPPPVSPRRLLLAQALSFLGLVAALVGGLGPADHLRSTYSWPPTDLPQGAPSRVWYTPLLLIRHRPEAITATIPCSLPPALPAADRPVTVLATARSPETAGGLAVVREGSGALVSVGGKRLGRVPLASGGGPECVYQLRFGRGRWSLEGGADAVSVGGSLGSSEMPVVTGLFSALDVSSGPAPTIEVTTPVHATRTNSRQTLAWMIAALCVVAALLLVAVERRPRPLRWAGHGFSGAVAHAHPADGVVGLVLLGWWVIAPASVDDGWIYVRERLFSVSGGFSAYYNAFGANLPNDYWLEWVQHWLSESTSSLIFLRFPALVCLTATWVVSRWILARILGATGAHDGVALWALASAFLVGGLAWGMTMRPEPVTALLVTASMACAVRFLERRAAAALATLAVLVPLALTAHHAGVASIAPALAAAPSLLRWAREQLAIASTIAASSIALLTTLLFVGSDVEQRGTDAQLTSAYGSFQLGWRDEIERYADLASYPAATPLRRASVVLIGLAVLAFLFRRRRQRGALLGFPATSLGLALVLFIVTPTKLVWHFGALLGIGAVALASETARIRDAFRERPRWDAWPFVAIGVATLAIAWCWSPREPWSNMDLRELDWTPGFEASASMATLAAVIPLAALLALTVMEITRGRRKRLPDVPWRALSWIAPAFALPLIVFTTGVLVADTAKTESWTQIRQNIDGLRGDAGCGLADDVVVPRGNGVQPLLPAGQTEARSPPEWIPPPPVADLDRFALGPEAEASSHSPWFELPAAGRTGLFVSGTLRPSEDLELEWGRRRAGRVESLGTDAVGTTFTAGAVNVLPWRFMAAGELPPPRSGADAVRVGLRTDARIRSAVAVTAPVMYANEPLVRRVGQSRTLVLHYLVTYFPCMQPARLSSGIVEVPRFIVVAPNSPSPVGNASTSPFAGALDLYRLERLPVTDSEDPPRDVLVFAVDQEIAGAARAPASVSTRSS